MIWLKKNLTFTIIMVVLAGILAFEMYLILGQRATARAAEADFREKVDESKSLAGKKILPHPANIDLTKAEIDRQREELEIYLDSLQGDDELQDAFAGHPSTRVDALFDIEFFVAEYRRLGVKAGLKEEDLEDETFGFGSYIAAGVGPERSNLATVYKQRLIVAHILDRLFEAQPEGLVAVQRPGEEGASPEDRAERAPRGRDQQAPAGSFRLNPQLSTAIPEIAETLPFQVVFTGRAPTLRAFLNSLANYEMPLIVRKVEVGQAGAGADRPAQQTERRRRAPAAPRPERQEEEGSEAPKEENVPLVADNLSQFTVALEFVEVLPRETPGR